MSLKVYAKYPGKTSILLHTVKTNNEAVTYGKEYRAGVSENVEITIYDDEKKTSKSLDILE